MTRRGIAPLIGLAVTAVALFLNLWLGILLQTQSVVVDIFVLLALATNILAAVLFARSRCKRGPQSAGTDSIPKKRVLSTDQRLLYTSWLLLFVTAIFWSIGFFMSLAQTTRLNKLKTTQSSLRARQVVILKNAESQYLECKTDEERQRFFSGMVKDGHVVMPFILDLFDYTEDVKLKSKLIGLMEDATGLALRSALTRGQEAGPEEIRRLVSEWETAQGKESP